MVQGSRGQTCRRTKCWLQKKKKNGGGGDADVDDGEGFPDSIYTNSRSTASAAATGSNDDNNRILIAID